MSIRSDFRMTVNGRYAAMARLIVVNVAVFLLLNIGKVVMAYLAGSPSSYAFVLSLFMLPADLGTLLQRFWTPVLYGFAHTDFFHILFNMLMLYWFGRILLEFQSGKRLVSVYVLGVLVGGMAFLVIYNLVPRYSPELSRMLGASAGVSAVVVAAATLVPNYKINLLLIGPVKIVYVALVSVVLLSFFRLGQGNDGGQFAHLGGAALGCLYIVQLRRGSDLGKPVEAIIDFFVGIFKPKPKIRVSRGGGGQASSPKASGSASQAEIDAILDKISDKGYDSLSKEEKRKLFEASKK